MTHTFADALPVILHEEGGFSDNPADPGGATMDGVTQGVWQQWVGHAVTAIQLQQITPDQIAAFYQAEYWDKVSGDNLPDGLNLCVFDFAVNHGPHGAATMLQGLVSVTQDGAIGPATLAAISALIASHSAAELVQAYSDARTAFYRTEPDFAKFGRGWLNRVGYVEGVALSWIARNQGNTQ
jgi:lysozyme family protein